MRAYRLDYIAIVFEVSPYLLFATWEQLELKMWWDDTLGMAYNREADYVLATILLWAFQEI